VRFGDLIEARIIPVVSSGNNADEDEDGNKIPYMPGIATPACVKGAVAVGLVSNGWDYVDGKCAKTDVADYVPSWSQSSWADSQANVAIFAPGLCILGAGGYKSGTSMAAPHVTAAVADLASAKDADSATMIAMLTQSGPTVTDPNSKIVRHRLDIQAAIDSLLAGSAPVATGTIGGAPSPGGGGPGPGSGSAGGGGGGSFPVLPVILVVGVAIAGYWWYRGRKSQAG
jgi:subtilisin family serine protease